ncbi:hypothetical protein BVRB_7g163470 [Beta vulgaris subsp. vulgaris]|nr:hypothetical protein BVRB_7g163470 [Beta vulgaris subsp. vulgaris]
MLILHLGVGSNLRTLSSSRTTVISLLSPFTLLLSPSTFALLSPSSTLFSLFTFDPPTTLHLRPSIFDSSLSLLSSFTEPDCFGSAVSIKPTLCTPVCDDELACENWNG